MRQAKTFPRFFRYADKMSCSFGHFLPFNFLMPCVVVSRSVSYYCINIFTSVFSYILIFRRKKKGGVFFLPVKQ